MDRRETSSSMGHATPPDPGGWWSQRSVGRLQSAPGSLRTVEETEGSLGGRDRVGSELGSVEKGNEKLGK